MIPLGLSPAEMRALIDTLTGSHSVHVTVQVLDLNGNHLADVSDMLLSGQVNIDDTASVTRSATLSLLDPNHSLHFDSDSPTDGAIYVDRMILIAYSVKAPGAAAWVDIPLFRGPVSKMDRTNDVVNIEAQGKEVLAQGAAWKTWTYKKNHRRVDVIQSILHDLTGETRFSFPEHSARLPADISVGRASVPWNVASHIAKGMNMQLFYDGRGVARLRRLPTTSSFTFKSGDGGTVLTPPQVTYTTENLKNLVWVRGAGKISVSKAAPYSHPLSPHRLGRNGVPRYLLDEVQDTSIRTKKEALDVMNTRLTHSLLTAVEVSFDAMAIPFLEPGDVARVTTGDFSNAFRVHQLSIPLVVGGTMTVGYLKNRSPNKRRIR